MHTEAPPRRSVRIAQGLLVAAVLIACLLILCSYGRHVPVVGDETLGYYTINQPTLHALLHLQRTAPLVFEPPTFDLLAHISGAALGFTAMSIRIPSILSFVLLQFFLFSTVRTIAGFRPALLAVLLPMGLGITTYATQARPYALVLAASMAALFFWQYASHHTRFRGLALCGLAIALAVATTSQFYGVLLVLPLAAGELLRTASTKRWRVATWVAIAAGTSTVLLVLPFRDAVAPYKEQVPRNANLGLGSIAETYYSLLLRSHRFYRPGRETILSLVMAGVLIFLLYNSYRYIRSTAGLADYLPEWLAFSVLALFPLLIVPIAYWLVGTYQSRHGIICVLGFIVLSMLCLARGLEQIPSKYWNAMLVLGGLLGPILLSWQLRHMRIQEDIFLASLQPPEPLRVFADQNPDRPIYVTVDQCLDAAQNLPPALLSHLRCLYSEHSLRFVYLTEESLIQHTNFPIRFASYDEFKRYGPAYLAYTPVPTTEWIPKALQADGAEMEPLSPGLGGTIYRVSTSGK